MASPRRWPRPTRASDLRRTRRRGQYCRLARAVIALAQSGPLRLLPCRTARPTDCTRIADKYIGTRRPIPGFGHPCHTPDDPRTPALFAVAAEARLPGHHVALLRQMSATVDARAGKHLTIKATGAIGALLQEIGVPQSIMRAVAVISRCGGLARHIMKERQTKSARTIWKLTEDNIPYVPS